MGRTCILPPGQAARNKVLCKYKIAARLRGHEWALSDARFDELLADNCHYCGLPPSNVARKNKTSRFVYSGIDRKNSSIGYIEGNVVSCCKTCNLIKSLKSYEEFTAYLDRVAAFRSSIAKGAVA